MAEGSKTVLTTGANGFVGSRLCRRFSAAGFGVVAGVRKTADLSLLDGVDVAYRYGDVTRPETLPGMVRGIDVIIHNAGVVKAKRRETFFAVNEQGTRSLLEAVATHNPDVKRVVLVSSMAASGPSEIGRPRTESDPPAPVTTYGESKLAGETVAQEFVDRLPLTIVRPSGVYGPGDKEMFSVFKTAWLHLRPMIGNMNRRLQVVHVDDLCEAVYKASTVDTKSGSVYFVAEQRGYDMRAFIATFARASRKWCLPLVIPGRLFVTIAAVSEFASKLAGATPMLTREKTRELLTSWEVSVERARQELGFEASIPLERGVRETYDWYLNKGWLK